MKKLLERAGAILLAIMFVVTLFQVVARDVLGISAVWSEELARFIYVCLVFVAAIPLIKTDEHIKVGILTDRAGRRMGSFLRFLTNLLTIPFIAVMTWGAWTNSQVNWKTYAPTLDWLSIGYVYLVICLAGILMLWYLSINVFRQIRALIGFSVKSEGSRP